jgi:hypothetical protein
MYYCILDCSDPTIKKFPYYGDTTFIGTTLFESKFECDTCQWWIGSEATPRYGQKISILFDEPYDDVRIRLICKKYSTCNGVTELRLDTADTTIQVVERANYSLMSKFKGTWSHIPGQEYEIEFFDTTVQGITYVGGRGLNTQCVLSYPYGFFPGGIQFTGGVSCFLGNPVDTNISDVYGAGGAPPVNCAYYFKERDSIHVLKMIWLQPNGPSDTVEFFGVRSN